MTTYMGRDAVSLEHDVRHALAARLEDRQRQVQTAENLYLVNLNPI